MTPSSTYLKNWHMNNRSNLFTVASESILRPKPVASNEVRGFRQNIKKNFLMGFSDVTIMGCGRFCFPTEFIFNRW